MKREFLIDRQGRQFVLYAGLLDAAHAAGLKAIRTRLVQPPLEVNGQTTIVHCEVEMGDGRVFTGIGDATPTNVGRNIAPHAVRMAETRSKARALRDALNIGAVALEELGGDEEPAPPAAVPWYERNGAPPASIAAQTPATVPLERLVDAQIKEVSPLWPQVVAMKARLEKASVGYAEPDRYAPTDVLASWMNTQTAALRAKTGVIR